MQSNIKDDEMKPKYIFQDLLGCDDGLYMAWGFESYQKYLDNIGRKLKFSGETFNNEILESNLKVQIAICLIVMSAVAVSIIAIWKLKREWLNKTISFIKSPFYR